MGPEGRQEEVIDLSATNPSITTPTAINQSIGDSMARDLSDLETMGADDSPSYSFSH